MVVPANDFSAARRTSLYILMVWILSRSACHSFMPPKSIEYQPRNAAGLFESPSSTFSSPTTADDNSYFFKALPQIERVFCLSDLHVDHVLNMDWIKQKMTRENCTLTETDLMIVAGDISHDLEKFEDCLKILTQHGSGPEVLFVVGNHEAWLTPQEVQEGISSLDKINRIYELCERVDKVHIGSVKVGSLSSKYPLMIVNLDSWYDGSLSLECCEYLCSDFGRWPWVDFIRCRWGANFPLMGSPNNRIPKGLSEYLLLQNKNVLRQIEDYFQSAQGTNMGLLTVSHFLPNQQSLPDWKNVSSPEFLADEWLDHGAGHMSAKFAKVAGSKLIDEQIRAIDLPTNTRRMHLFGHSHRPKDFEYNGIRYIHNPLGKPREREIHMISPNVDFQCIWNCNQGEEDGETIIRYWEEKGGGLDALRMRLSQTKKKSRYHRKHAKIRRQAKHSTEYVVKNKSA